MFKYDFEKAKKKYYIVETEAPTGFNKCEEIIEVEVSKNRTWFGFKKVYYKCKW